MDNPWDFQLFRERPFLKIEEDIIIPVSKDYLLDQIYQSMYWKIRRCYPAEDENFIRFYGKVFEVYIQNMGKEASNKAKLKYSFINEYKYNRGSRSPDAFLMLGDKLLVIECKGKSVTETSKVKGEPSSIEKDFQRLVVDPYNQVIMRLLEIKEQTNEPIDLSKIKGYYIIIINHSNFPHLALYEDRKVKMINSEERLPLKYFDHFEIEEFELLCSLIGRTNRKPIFRVLDQHFEFCPGLEFKNFLHTYHYPVRLSENIRKNAREIIDYSLRRLL